MKYWAIYNNLDGKTIEEITEQGYNNEKKNITWEYELNSYLRLDEDDLKEVEMISKHNEKILYKRDMKGLNPAKNIPPLPTGIPRPKDEYMSTDKLIKGNKYVVSVNDHYGKAEMYAWFNYRDEKGVWFQADEGSPFVYDFKYWDRTDGNMRRTPQNIPMPECKPAKDECINIERKHFIQDKKIELYIAIAQGLASSLGGQSSNMDVWADRILKDFDKRFGKESK